MWRMALLLLALLALLRLWEVYVSARRLRAAIGTGGASPLPDPVYPWMVLVHVGWFCGCAAESLLRARHPAPWVTAAALGVLGGALGLRAWTLATLGALWNVRLVRRPRQPIVTAGPYRLLRHPNYLAVILEIAAVPAALGAWWTALGASLLNGAVLWARIRREEAYLFSVPGYAAAFRDKKRILPGVF
jgi:methyltransferase